MHVSTEVRDLYLARELPEPTLQAIDLHVSSCLSCAERLTDASLAAGRWERRGLLGRLVRVEPVVAEPAIEEEAPRVAA